MGRRFSHSKVDQFKKCPKKYDYQYVQDLNPIDESIHLSLGKIVHSALEAISKEETIHPYLEEFKELVRQGKLKNCTENTLERVLQMHVNHYADENVGRNLILIEDKFEEDLKDDDVFSGIFDLVFEKDSYYYLEDYKTTINKLKYTKDDVRLNRQLHKYSKVLFDRFFIDVDFITINEIVIRELDDVPLLKNLKPTKDTKQLAFVLYEDYLHMLEELGLEKDQAYQGALTYLKDRGHPLFRKTTVELNKNIVESIDEEYKTVITAMKGENYYRNPSPLCNYCAFKDICNMELQGDQEEYVKELKETHFKPREVEDAEETL